MIAKDNSLDKNRYLLDNFDRALEEGWIEVYYQPIVRSANGRVCAEEALVRWDDPIMGILNPGDFIAILEAVNIVHRLDLYVLERVLEKLKQQSDMGLYLVPISVNFSQIDFYSCNIVEEVNKRVDVSGVARDRIAIGISEVAIAGNHEQVINCLDEFKKAGYGIWLDDYGSGFISPLLLQQIQFDLLKVNMGLVSQISYNESSKVVITELVRMALSLGMETSAEGLENHEQAQFLEEIGCAKLQGFYFCKPIPKEVIFERYRNGKQIGFENPLESAYYSALGKISLYDMSFMLNEEDDELGHYFDTLPMAIVETDSKHVTVLRSNRNFRKFMELNDEFYHKREGYTYEFDEKAEGAGFYTLDVVRQCGADGKKRLIDDRTKDGKTIQVLIHRVAINDVKNVSAVACVILSITEKAIREESLTYNYIARTLAEDYIQVYYVDLETGKYAQYKADGTHRNISIDNTGDDFFGRINEVKERMVYADDLELFNTSCTKENIVKCINENGSFSVTYRVYMDGTPTYIQFKAVRLKENDEHIIIGINNVDAQMRQQETIERLKEERTTYNRIMALAGDFICIYTVDAETGHYRLYKTTNLYQELNIDTEGDNFYYDSIENARGIIHKDDIPGLTLVLTKENVLDEIERKGMFIYNYRLYLDGRPIYVSLKATIVEEMEGPCLLFGVINVDEQIRKDMAYEKTLLMIENEAVKDGLTGVKNKRAFVYLEEQIDELMAEKKAPEYALVMCDLNGLKTINDTQGHQAGDAFIVEGCKMICKAFPHSPVYRIGGDEFLVYVKGQDYDTLDDRIETIKKQNRHNKKKNAVTIAVGVAYYTSSDNFVTDVFERADSAMYTNKQLMKAEGY